jgi:RNA recognition motif-containing protein
LFCVKKKNYFRLKYGLLKLKHGYIICMTSIFVAKLDFNITNEQLKQAFQAYGTVLKATVATDRETGKSRGFGFVEMANRDQALTAIKELDGSLLNGRPIAVKEADQRPEKRPNRENRPDFNRAPRDNRSDFNRNREQGSSPRTTSSERVVSRDTPPIPLPSEDALNAKKIESVTKTKSRKKRRLKAKQKSRR